MADDEMRDKEAADDLDPAFDSIDATMKGVARTKVTVTPEALAQIVNDAVAKAITAYEQSRGATPDSAGASQGDPAASTQARRAKIEQLKGEMGLDEIEFEGPRPEPVEVRVQRELSSQMGVHDFEFEDAPGAAAPPDAPTRTEADAIAGWATKVDAIAGWVKPVQDPAPPATPDADQTPAPAAAEEKTDDAVPKFDWVAEELARLEAEQITAPPEVEPAPYQEPEPVARAIPETVAPAIEEPPAAPKPEVRETLSSLASWFRSVLGDQSREREPAAAAPVPEPESPAMPAAPPPPEPPVVAPPPVVARTEEPPRPARGPGVALKPMTPEEAAKTISFTFDPIPPVPPRLPREPKEPPKKIKKSGTFL